MPIRAFPSPEIIFRYVLASYPLGILAATRNVYENVYCNRFGIICIFGGP
jgi:hypothetical protein